MRTKPLAYCTFPGCTHRRPPGHTPRCQEHETAHDRARGTRQQRGCDTAHDQARARLIAALPTPCAYCGQIIHTPDELVAAHIKDGDPTAGWWPAHAPCNERAKRR